MRGQNFATRAGDKGGAAMSGTFSGSSTVTQYLTVSSQSPFTVTSGGVINVNSAGSGAAGISGNNSYAWNVLNFGTVASIGSLGIGIDLAAGGTINNGQSGVATELINGTGEGIRILGSAGTVTNYGRITQTGGGGIAGILLGAGGSVANSGTISAAGTSAVAVDFGAAGSLTN